MTVSDYRTYVARRRRDAGLEETRALEGAASGGIVGCILGVLAGMIWIARLADAPEPHSVSALMWLAAMACGFALGGTLGTFVGTFVGGMIGSGKRPRPHRGTRGPCVPETVPAAYPAVR